MYEHITLTGQDRTLCGQPPTRRPDPRTRPRRACPNCLSVYKGQMYWVAA